MSNPPDLSYDTHMESDEMSTEVPEYGFKTGLASHTMAYLIPAIKKLSGDRLKEGARVLDVGCGNGYLVGWCIERGCVGVGLDLSKTGIEIARREHPEGRFELLAADENVLKNLREDPFDVVVSTEVVEHLYAPRDWARGCLAALRPGGRLICSTPYHGYIKNLALSLTDKWDHHWKPLWDGGHIKFWSPMTLAKLLTECGFENVQWVGAGRLPQLWKSLVMSADRPR